MEIDAKVFKELIQDMTRLSIRVEELEKSRLVTQVKPKVMHKDGEQEQMAIEKNRESYQYDYPARNKMSKIQRLEEKHASA
jgi:hypothetical protein